VTDRRLIDSHKLHFHPERVAQWNAASREGEWALARDIYPIYVEISPVGACNHRCTFCAVDYIGYTSDQLDGAVLRERLREMAKLGVKSVMFAGEGEPLLHKETNTNVIAGYAARLDMAFTTNGVLLHKLREINLCKWVRISLNAGKRDTYAAVHRTKAADFDTVLRNIKDAVKRKGTCDLGVQCVVLPENVSEIETLYKLCDDIGVDYLIAKPYSQHKKSETHEYEGKRPWSDFLSFKSERGHCEFIYRAETAATTRIPYDKCHATPSFWAYVMANGDVYSCSAYLLDDRFKMGNINDATFKSVWQSEKRRLNWEFVREGLDIHECRVNCRMDKVKRYLTELVAMEHDKNFI